MSDRANVRLGEALPIKYGKSKSAQYGVQKMGVPVYGSSGQIGTFDRALTSGPSLIVGRKGSAGAVYYSPTPCWPIDTVYYAEAKPGVHLPFFRYLLESLRLGQFDRSTAVPSLSRDDYNAIQISVPPEDLQRRIVAELETQLTRLDASVTVLKRAQANLKRYRASVLKAACEGRLVSAGHSQDSAKELLAEIIRERLAHGAGERIRTVNLEAPTRVAHLPPAWCWATVDQLGEVGTGATPRRGRAAYYEGGTVPWVTSGAVGDSFVREATEFVTAKAIAETNLTLYPPGTLLVAMYGEGKTRGKCSELLISATTNQALAAIQAHPSVRAYLKIFLQMNYEETRKAASGGVQPNLNLSLIRSINVALPPREQQIRIVAEVDRRLSVIEELESTVVANLKRTGRLRQALLVRAFAPPA